MQDLLYSKAISFTPSGPNVKNNFMLTYEGPFFSALEESVSQKMVTKVDKIQPLMMVIREQLLIHGLIPTNHVSSDDYVSNLETCEELKGCIQQLIDQGTVHVGRFTKEEEDATLEIPCLVVEVQIPINLLIIQVLAPFPFESTKVIPWRYESAIYMQVFTLAPT